MCGGDGTYGTKVCGGDGTYVCVPTHARVCLYFVLCKRGICWNVENVICKLKYLVK